MAGSTGATGRELLALPQSKLQLDIVAHARPNKAREQELDPRTVVLDLGDPSSLDEALRDRTTVVQLIGTVRARFGAGDTYESSDVGTTRSLVEASRRAGIDHFILLSAVGAGTPVGAYLKAKAAAEELVRQSGVPFTIFRPSTFEGGRQPRLPGVSALLRGLGLAKVAPIALVDLAQSILWVARTRGSLGEVLEGKSLWRVVEAARSDVRSDVLT